MKVRYNPYVGIIALVVGSVCVFLGLWLTLLGTFNPAVVVGLMPVLIGILYLVRPYFLVTPTAVQVTALIGSIQREYPYQWLEVDGGKLLAVSGDGTRTRVPVARWLANSIDWAAVVPR